MILLDTNVLSALRRPERAEQVARWLRAQPDDALFLSVVTIGEIERGIALQAPKNPDFARDLADWLSATMDYYADRILDFGAAEARIWGRLSAEIGSAGADLMIAATALHHGAAVATRNVTDFRPTGVAVIDPFAG
ncbi:VapC toxin protein (plasmid) [Rhodovulum sp. P5]|uniref:type II toxin-antitoxin system VapC family toxin n=1 Tax=Rhodovulum sp. P5 TaxID=1564506 RepID=UPI0009C30866|nr:type II toxin-antitoxin system VapC family toxin [Rhodovulum sp. P5]ARE42443.1 VapC toxin protein [Rhodovulum sp. P5]